MTVEDLENAERTGEYLMQLLQSAVDSISQVIAWANQHTEGAGPLIHQALADVEHDLHQTQDRYAQIHAQLQNERAEAGQRAQQTEQEQQEQEDQQALEDQHGS